MESRYLSKYAGIGVSEAINMGEHFNDYGAKVFGVEIGVPNSSLAQYMGITEDTVNEVARICRHELLVPEILDDLQVPYEGFRPDFAQDNVPESSLSLATLRALKRRNKDVNRKLDRHVLRYRGEISLEEDRVESNLEDLKPLQHYVLTVRIYLPGVHVKSSTYSRTSFPQVSQEFSCLSSELLVHLRDRILCSSDYQSTTGDVSNDPFITSTTRTKDVNSAAMFYLGNDLYVDSRQPGNADCCHDIQKWCAAKGYNLGKLLKMEEITWQDIGEIRLGYPYLYMHQKICEHLIVVTDARYLVVGNDKLPYEVAHFCTICLLLFNYVDRIKIGNFQVFKYVDRASLI